MVRQIPLLVEKQEAVLKLATSKVPSFAVDKTVLSERDSWSEDCHTLGLYFCQSTLGSPTEDHSHLTVDVEVHPRGYVLEGDDSLAGFVAATLDRETDTSLSERVKTVDQFSKEYVRT